MKRKLTGAISSSKLMEPGLIVEKHRIKSVAVCCIGILENINLVDTVILAVRVSCLFPVSDVQSSGLTRDVSVMLKVN